jgi:hypothetical protein
VLDAFQAGRRDSNRVACFNWASHGCWAGISSTRIERPLPLVINFMEIFACANCCPYLP